ncbi:MAG TPA: aminoglycoside 6'-N-acetyltransferase [Xanthobacteraceae bacterium]|jgi:aminoglycoside 6'-N-acetyltransferase I
MNVTVREMDASDRAAWAAMRTELWPDEPLSVHQSELREFLQRGNFWGFVAEVPNGEAAGFAEFAIRDYANGCLGRPVAFLEGIWVKPQFRRQGIGARLLKAVEAFLTARGFTELGSDAAIDNRESHVAHAAWGFKETERVVYFRKDLKPVGS